MNTTIFGSGRDRALRQAVHEVDDHQKAVVLSTIQPRYGEVAGKTFARWGLSFEPGTDDLREAGSRALMDGRWAAGAKVQAFAPVARPTARASYGGREDLVIVDSAAAACGGADALLIMAEWRALRSPEFRGPGRGLKQRLVFDGHSIHDPALPRQFGFGHCSSGRAVVRLN